MRSPLIAMIGVRPLLILEQIMQCLVAACAADRHISAVVIVAASIFVVSMTFAAQDRFTVKSPNAIAFSEFKGYDAWQVIAPVSVSTPRPPR